MTQIYVKRSKTSVGILYASREYKNNVNMYFGSPIMFNSPRKYNANNQPASAKVRLTKQPIKIQINTRSKTRLNYV